MIHPSGVKKPCGQPKDRRSAGTTRSMEDRQPAPGLLHRLWLRLLDGDRPWGSLDIRPDRFGVTRYRLVVYPPGITDTERHRVRLSRSWPLWGAVMWIACEIWLNPQLGPWPAISVSTAAALAAGGVALALAGDARNRVRVMATMIIAGHNDPVSAAACRKLKTLAATLLEADKQRSLGQISPIEQEAVWWRVYDEMAPGAAELRGFDWSERNG
jgi:hypothetical protein